MFRTRLGGAHRGAEAPPENADQDVAFFNLQDRVDESLRPLGMEAGMGVGFPAVNIEVKAARSGGIAIHFLDDAGNDFALGFDIAGRSDDETQYSNMLLRR